LRKEEGSMMPWPFLWLSRMMRRRAAYTRGSGLAAGVDRPSPLSTMRPELLSEEASSSEEEGGAAAFCRSGSSGWTQTEESRSEVKEGRASMACSTALR
jgi:hypothetical protein